MDEFASDGFVEDAGADAGAPVMHVITNFAASGGAETMLARLLAATSDPAVVVSLIDVSERNLNLAGRPDVEYHSLNARGAVQMPGAILQLTGLMREKRPRAVLCWMYHAMVVGTLSARLAGAPPVFWTVRQALDDPRSLTRSTRIAVAGARILSSRAAGIVYNSARAREQHEQYGYAARYGKVIPNGVVVPMRLDLTPRKARVFGIAARFHPQKDHLTFFRAAAQIAAQFPDARFVAAGHGLDERNGEVLAMVAEAGLDPARLKLLGELRDMEDFYSQIDVLVLSSRTEGFPNVVAEAMSHARPVVTTDVGDAALIVADTGKVVSPGDPDALSEAIADVARLTAEEVADLGRRARQRVEENYQVTHILDEYREVLSQRVPA
ncbi:putative glycosyltransferase protein [Stappia aggregata IAM 12614]|uniref:Putative glycosyltransferase protein n=1 Tax=Roseibium aggregatum (strain ATCC 25650 / DSM 13394 / JCM 20685 / NBRC 16684 / NCIMB 2208 / IAM 12614 / B1) TaxID=384765 RepID=A0NNT5_ROSAI|nr:glycosyltransferase [Roseibium aggregatum]EAV45816.1 putative glycosyltransferase protein [Stappia aggregata IAM 12614] [Roseibium aggregatum IAM 12614]